jgi:hypothetical protein
VRGGGEEQGNFSSLAVKTKQKGKLLLVVLGRAGEERNKGIYHPM